MHNTEKNQLYNYTIASTIKVKDEIKSIDAFHATKIIIYKV